MYFEKEHLYHVYNQGNNKQRIFFTRENYLYFLRKIRTHILPYSAVLAYCLMPNHFHLMIKVLDTTKGFASSEALGSRRMRSLNDSVGIMLRSYTVAINIQEGRTGTLFRKKTKAQCLTLPERVSPSYFNSAFGTYLNTETLEFNYPQNCFSYIHRNPVDAGLAEKPEEWEFSSALDYANLRNGTLVNKAEAIAENLF